MTASAASPLPHAVHGGRSRRSALRLGLLLCGLMFAGLAASPTAWAQSRNIPAAAKRAHMQPPVGNLVELGGETFVLSAAAQIRDRDNRIVLPGMVREAAVVRYQLDTMGNLWRVWILTDEEAAKPEP